MLASLLDINVFVGENKDTLRGLLPSGKFNQFAKMLQAMAVEAEAR